VVVVVIGDGGDLSIYRPLLNELYFAVVARE
jgi:hypothetical protein